MPQQLEGPNMNHSAWNCSSRSSVLSEVNVDNKLIPFAAHFLKSTISFEPSHKYNTVFPHKLGSRAFEDSLFSSVSFGPFLNGPLFS